MVFPGTIPLPAKSVLVDGVEFPYLPASYKVTMAPTFGQKLSIGDPKYADLDFAVSAHSITALTGGYGLRRYSDMTTPAVAAQEEPAHKHDYLESSDIDCRGVPIILGPLQAPQDLPSITATPVWGGEFVVAGVRYFVVVAGQKVWRSTNLTTWTDTGLTLAAVPLQGAVGVYGGKIIFGYGGAAIAQFTANLSTLGTVTKTGAISIYVWAFSADRAAAYVAGGSAIADGYKVLASNDQTAAAYVFDTSSEVVCGKLDSIITALAPGGGIDVVMVGKEDELGAILPETPARYSILVPFDSYGQHNNRGMRWWMGAHEEEQRGPMILIFPRDRHLWAYQPSDSNAGTAANISPWGDVRRPPNIRGRITAIQGTARWLYYAVQNGAGETWIVARDARTGCNHPIMSLGMNTCTMLAVSTLGVTNPRLLVGKGNGLVTTILPLDGEMPVDDAACRYAITGTLILPDIDLNLPAEDKITYSILVAAENLTVGGRTITIESSYDGAAYETVGVIDVSPTEELDFEPPSSVKRIGIRLTFVTNSTSESPQLLAVVLRASINAKLYRIWTFRVTLPPGSLSTLTDGLFNPYTQIANLWTKCARGIPVPFRDRWNDVYTVRIKEIAEEEVFREENRSPETVMDFALLATKSVPVAPPGAGIPDTTVWQLDDSVLGAGTVLG